MVFGDLEGEDGDAAGTLDKDCAARLEVTTDDEGVPSGDGGAGEGSGLGETHGVRDADEASSGDGDLLAEDTVHGTPKC